MYEEKNHKACFNDLINQFCVIDLRIVKFRKIEALHNLVWTVSNFELLLLQMIQMISLFRGIV